jgi:uncharacterized protein
MKKGKGLHTITFFLLVVGGLNWLLLALFNWEIGQIFGGMEAAISKIIYILVGLAALSEIFSHKNSCRHCGNGKESAKSPEQSSPPPGNQPQ